MLTIYQKYPKLIITFLIIFNIVIILCIYYFYIIKNAEQIIINLFKENEVDIIFNGNREFDIQVLDKTFYNDMILNDSSLAFGEGYMYKKWDTRNLRTTLKKIMMSKLYDNSDNIVTKFNKLLSKFINYQSIPKSSDNVIKHYDIGNDLYRAMLDKYMNYTCGYWNNGAKTLDESQIHKMELIAKKLNLKDGMELLDLGCGFGGLAYYLVTNYKVKVIGVTLSPKQINYGKKNFKHDNLEFILMDYREYCNQCKKKFDRIYSVGILSHLGYKNFETYFKCVNKLLKLKGITLLHGIGNNTSITTSNLWGDKYIFPGGMLASIKQIAASVEKTDLILEDLHNFGPNYSLTLNEWEKNVNKFFKTTKNPKYTETFRRMWNFYLIGSSLMFKLRQIQLWQFVYSKKSHNTYLENNNFIRSDNKIK